MKRVGFMHPSINAINFISGFLINVNKKKSFELFYKHFLIIICCHLIKRYIYPFYMYTHKYKINKVATIQVCSFIKLLFHFPL